MRTNTKKRIVYLFLFAILILSIFFFANGVNTRVYAAGYHDPDLSVGEEELTPGGGDVSPSWSINKVDSPISGRTSWTNESRPLGFVLYLNGVSFGENQVHLQNKMTPDSVAKITFTRGEKTATPVLICASKDGGYESKSFFAFFFGGDLFGEPTNEYQEGDTVKIDQGCVLKCAQGTYPINTSVKYTYDGEQWTNGEKVEPETIQYSSVAVPVDGVTNWGKSKGYVGIVVYNAGLDFGENQTQLQNKPMTKTEKVTFTRGDKTEKCALIVAGLDGTKNISYCSYFFGGVLENTTLQVGDVIKFESDFAFTTAEGRYTYGVDLEFIFDGVQWVDKASSDESLTYITYISEPQEEGNNIIFNLKTTTIFGAYDIVTEELKQSILVNDVTVKDLISNGKASIGYTISGIVLSVDKGALKLNDYDTISIKKGALLKGDETDGLRLKDDQTFRYSYTLKRADYIPDHEYYGKLSSMAIIDNVEIAGDTSNAVINGEKYDLAHSIWIHFKWSAKMNYDSFQVHLSADQFVSTGVLNEKLCYEYQKLGFFYSVTDLLKVNGKSIYEWMILDAKNGTGDSFYIEYLPYEIDSGRVLRIVVADESLMDIGLNVTQSIEFKNGFINPNLGEIQDDSFYSIKAEDAKMNVKLNMVSNQENMVSNQENGNSDKGSGCSGEIRLEYSSVVLLVGALLLSSLVLFRKWRRGDR